MKLTLVLALLIFSVSAYTQDLNARVQVLSPKIQNTNKQTLTVLETSIKDFLNGRQWSADALQAQERIDCNFVITITEWDGSSSFKAEAQIQSSRPVYGTSYNSTVLNLSDKDFDFNYSEGQALEFSDQNYINNLSSMLAYYAYIIVAMDGDTFSKMSGTANFNKAQVIVNNAQNTSNKGWKAFEGLRNRYWLVENFTNKSYNIIRESLYDYHRNGLDIMANDQLKGRKVIFSLLPQLQKIDKQKQGSMVTQIFFTSKADELINILSGSDPQEKMKAYNILTEIDPGNITKYEGLKK